MRQEDLREFQVSLVVHMIDFRPARLYSETLFKKERKITIAKHVFSSFKECLGLDRAPGLGYSSVVECLPSM